MGTAAVGGGVGIGAFGLEPFVHDEVVGLIKPASLAPVLVIGAVHKMLGREDHVGVVLDLDGVFHLSHGCEGPA